MILPIGYFLPQILGGGNQLVLDLARVPYPVLTILLYFVIRFIWSMLSYGSGLPGGIFLPILALGSLLGAIVGTFLQNIGFISQNQLPLFIILGMSGYFGAISKAPLTAMILVTEMVGDIRSLMPLGMVTLLAYMIMDLFHGAPVYEAMLEQLLPDKAQEEGELTLIEIPVSEKIAGKQVHELHLPQDILITTQMRSAIRSMVQPACIWVIASLWWLKNPKSDGSRIFFCKRKILRNVFLLLNFQTIIEK